MNIDNFQWMQAFEVIIVDITLKMTHFNSLLTAVIFALICFYCASGLAFLLSLNFLFTRIYYISTRVEVFHIIAIFFNSVHRVETSIRDESLHIKFPMLSVSIHATTFCERSLRDFISYIFASLALPKKM